MRKLINRLIGRVRRVFAREGTNAKPGRYFIILADDRVVVAEATTDQIDLLYRRFATTTIAVRGFSGYGWIDPQDYPDFPVTVQISTFL